MYFDSGGKSQFLNSECAQLRAARDSAARTSLLARAAWDRAEAELLRSGDIDLEAAETHAFAMRERYRVADREACALRDEVAELEYELDLDEEYDEAA